MGVFCGWIGFFFFGVAFAFFLGVEGKKGYVIVMGTALVLK